MTGCRFGALSDCRSPRAPSTIRRFREELSPRGLGEALFQEVAHQMEARGLVVKAGTLIDATLIEAAVAPPPFKHGPVSPHDPDAGWTVRNGQSHFGYKAHLAVDEGSEIIRAAILTGAEVHDSQLAEPLIQGDEGTVYGDKAYGSTALRAKLADAGIKDGLMHKAARGKPLKTWQRWLNKALSSIRAAVERTCARVTHGYELARARYRGLRRNGCHLHLVCTAINLKRWLVLAA